MAHKLKSMDYAQRQLALQIFYVDKSGLPPEFVPQHILKDRFKKMKPISEISRAFSDHNKRYFNLHIDQICLFYTPNSQYAINEICYLPAEELIEVKDKPHYMLEPSGKDYPISCGFTLYFRDRYIILVAQSEAVYHNWLNHFEMIRFQTTKKPILTRLRTPYIQVPGIPQQIQAQLVIDPQSQMPPQQTPQQEQLNIKEDQLQKTESSPPKPESRQRPKSGRRLQENGQKLRQSSLHIQQQNESQPPVMQPPLTQAPSTQPPVSQPQSAMNTSQHQEYNSGVYRNTYSEHISNAPEAINKQKVMKDNSIIQSSRELHNKIDNQAIKEQSSIMKAGPVRPTQAINSQNNSNNFNNKNNILNQSNSQKPEKQQESPIKIIGDAPSQSNTQTARGRVMETPKQYIQPVRLDSNGRSYRKTTSQQKMEAPQDRPSTGRRASARNIWQDFDDDGNIIVKPKILQANFTGSLRMANESVVSPPQIQKNVSSKREEDDFDESEFMKNILGLKKPEPSPKMSFFLQPEVDIPKPQTSEPQGGFFLQSLKAVQVEPAEEDEIIDFSICQTPQKQPEAPSKKLTYDDWDDE